LYKLHKAHNLKKTMQHQQIIGDSYYELEGDDIQDDYAPVQFSPSEALVSGAIDPEGHLQAEDLWGVQTKRFFITTPEGATLEKLAANAKNGVNWEIPQEMKQLLRQVNKSQNRSLVSAKDLDGSLNKALFVGANVISYNSDCPKNLALDIPGLVPTVYTNTGRHNFVVPANCGNTVVKQSIFEPDNYFTRYMYEHNQKCDLKTLDQQIRFDMDPQKQYAVMNTHGVGWKVLLNNMVDPESQIAGAYDAICAKNEHIMTNPDPVNAQLAQVPYDVAKLVYDSIAKPLKEIEKAYVDFDNWRPKFTPANGEAWNSINGLVKDSTVFGTDSSAFETEAKLNTPFNAAVEVELKYVLGE